MALYESRHKAAAVEELQRPMDAAEFVLTAQFFVDLVALAVDAQQPIDYDAASEDRQSPDELSKLERERFLIERSLWAKYFDSAWAAAETRPPLVRARSLLQLFTLVGDTGRGFTTPLSTARAESLRSAVLSVFDQLPSSDQYWLLESQWRRLGGPDWLPALRALVATAPQPDQTPGQPGALDLALERILDLAPQEGRSLILAEIRRAKPRATAESLTRLPNEPIPALDDLLAMRLEESLGDLDGAVFAAKLVARYGSPAIYARVRKTYGDTPGNWACSLQASLIAYFLRHDPQEGTTLLNQALGERERTGCYRTVLADVARTNMSLALERVAIQHLDDANREIAANAVAVLGSHGSPAAEQSLWDTFQKWHNAWEGRVDELTAAVKGSQVDPQVRFEQSLVHALARSNRWIANRQKLDRMRELCLTPSSQADVERCINAWQGPVAIKFSPGDDGEFGSADGGAPGDGLSGSPDEDTWTVAQYFAQSLADLKKLLVRFPADTTFLFPVHALNDPQAEERLFTELQECLAPSGSKLFKAAADR
jgi:hypothetical protein